MYCTMCGKEIAEGSRFCPGCGAQLGGQPRPTSPPQQVTPTRIPPQGSPPDRMYSSCQPLPRPDKVGLAVLLLYVTLGIGLLRSLMEAPQQEAPLGLTIFTTLLVLGITGFFIFMIGKGKNWARITLLVLFIVGIPFSVPFLLNSLAANPISGLLGIAQTVVQAVALFFLFLKPSSDWFRQFKTINN